jgi:hypothetical protein
MTSNLTAALGEGMLDAIMLHFPPDCVVGIAIYATVDDAFAAGRRTRDRVTAQCGTTLRQERRVVGVLFHSLLPDESELAWRAEAQAMNATLATWWVSPEMRSDGDLERFIAEGYRRFEPKIRSLGLIDGMVIRYADDELVVLNLYADPIEGESAYAEAMTMVAEYAAGYMERIATQTGQAFDLPQLLARPSAGQRFRPPARDTPGD